MTEIKTMNRLILDHLGFIHDEKCVSLLHGVFSFRGDRPNMMADRLQMFCAELIDRFL